MALNHVSPRLTGEGFEWLTFAVVGILADLGWLFTKLVAKGDEWKKLTYRYANTRWTSVMIALYFILFLILLYVNPSCAAKKKESRIKNQESSHLQLQHIN